MAQTDPRLTTIKVARVLSYLVYFFVLVALVFLVLGFFLELFAANPDAGFSRWVYRNLDRVMEPFRGIFPTKVISDNGSTLDVSILFAMIVYGIAGLGLKALVDWLTDKMHSLEGQIQLDGDNPTRPPTNPL